MMDEFVGLMPEQAAHEIAAADAAQVGPAMSWSDDLGIGFYPVHGVGQYDAGYFEKYRQYAASRRGQVLTQCRIDFVSRFWKSEVIDIGIGSGQFVEAYGMHRAKGFDVNPEGVRWLRARGAYADPYAAPCQAATFWDSLEHIADPRRLLANVEKWAFVSLPIFEGKEHALRSKHFRPDEHYWYFTRGGFVWFMQQEGFCLREHATFEIAAGREDIESFAFQRAR